MAIDPKKDILKRGIIVSGKMSLGTIVERLKSRLLYDYKMGKFYTVPLEIFDKNNERDKKLLDELKLYFVGSTLKNQIVPVELFDFESQDECERFVEILESKSQKGINLFFNLNTDGQFSNEQREKLEEISNKSKDTMIIAATFFYHGDISLKKRLELMSKNKSNYKMAYLNSGKEVRIRGDFRRPENAHRNNWIFFDRNFYKKILSDAKKVGELADKDMYEVIPFFSKIDEALIGHSRSKSLTEIKNFVDRLGKNVRNQYERFLDKDVSSILESEELFEEYKKTLISIIEGLDTCGCLEELVNKENKNIKMLNEFLPEENHLDEVGKEELFETIRNFDINKREDVIDLIKYSRHFSNKMAHTIDDYMYATLCMDARENGTFEDRKLKTTTSVDYKLKELFNIDFDNQEQVETLKNQVLSADLTYQKYKKQLQFLTQKYAQETDPEKKAKLEERITKKESEIVNKEKHFDNCFNGFENKKKYNPFVADASINSYISNLDTVFIKRFGNKEEYIKGILEEFLCIMDDYKKAIIEKRGVPFTECPGYLEFFKAVKIEGSAEQYPEFNSLTCERDGIEYNIAEGLRNLIDTCKKDNLFHSIKIKMMYLADQYDSHEYAYNIKHNDTMGLVELINRGEPNLYIQQTPSENKNDGVVDLFEDGSIQIFGSHFKFDELEAQDSKIASFERVPTELDKMFAATGNWISLNTHIPMKRIRPDQKAVFLRLSETVEYLESGVQDQEKEQTLLNLDKIRALKNNPSKRKSYEALKVRIFLGAGLDKYKEHYSTRTTEEQNMQQENTSQNGISAANVDITRFSQNINMFQIHGTTQSDLIANGQEIIDLVEEEIINREEIKDK